jgi:DNA mismatch endonuclease (patch repair protein)
MDRVSAETRSRIMSAIRATNTGPERIVRSALHRLGYRFRIHVRELRGSPDIVLPRHRAIIFVHGCFWHLHHCPAGRSAPKTNAIFWRTKREGNRLRDHRTIRALRRAGWRCLVLWECQIRDSDRLLRALVRFLTSTALPPASPSRLKVPHSGATRKPGPEASGSRSRGQASPSARSRSAARSAGRSRSSR